jgi:hypothetical protein
MRVNPGTVSCTLATPVGTTAAAAAAHTVQQYCIGGQLFACKSLASDMILAQHLDCNIHLCRGNVLTVGGLMHCVTLSYVV